MNNADLFALIFLSAIIIFIFLGLFFRWFDD